MPTRPRKTHAVSFAGAGRATAGDVADVGSSDFCVEAKVRPDALNQVQPIACKSSEAHYLSLPGASGAYASTPDSAAVSITGDIDIRVKVALADWTPGAVQILASKYATIDNSRSWYFALSTDGKLWLVWSPDGIAANTAASTVATGLTDGAAKWVRATRSSSTGTVKFYLSDDGSTWVQLGGDVAGGSGALFDAAKPIWLGARDVDGSQFSLTGKLYSAEIRSGIDGPVVASFHADDFDVGATSGTSSQTGETWTINGRAKVKAVGDYWLDLPGVSGAYASTPDSAAVSITGDLDLRVQVALDDWTPGTSELVDKFDTSGSRSYVLRMSGGAPGRPELAWSADGTAANTATATDVVPFADGEIGWVRATLDVDNGAGGREVKFYTSTDGVTWTQLGSTVTTAGTTSIFDGIRPVSIGAAPNTGRFTAGKFYRAEIRNGVDGSVVARFDASDAAPGSTSLTSGATGEVWTISGAAALQGSAEGGWSLFWDAAGDLRIRLLDAGAKSIAGALSAAANWTADEESRVLVTFDRDGNATAYRDGVAVGTLSIASASGSLDNAGELQFAESPDGLSHLTGQLDNARLYVGRLLTAAEAAEHAAGTYVDETGLVGKWSFDEGTGSIAYDRSGQGNHLTLTGHSWTIVDHVFLSLGGVTVPVARDSVRLDDREYGWRGRTMDGQPIAITQGRKREWQLGVIPMARSEAETLRVLMRGEGEHWAFDATMGLYGDKGGGPTFGAANAALVADGVEVADGWVTLAVPGTHQHGLGATVLFRARDAVDGQMHHYALSGAVELRDGVPGSYSSDMQYGAARVTSLYFTGTTATGQETANVDVDSGKIARLGLPGGGSDEGVYDPLTPYNPGDLVTPSTPNGLFYQTDGSAGAPAPEPTWPTTYGATVVDVEGSTWTCLGPTATEVDELVVLPFALTQDQLEPVAMLHRVSGWPLMPALTADGDLVGNIPTAVEVRLGELETVERGGGLVRFGLVLREV